MSKLWLNSFCHRSVLIWELELSVICWQLHTVRRSWPFSNVVQHQDVRARADEGKKKFSTHHRSPCGAADDIHAQEHHILWGGRTRFHWLYCPTWSRSLRLPLLLSAFLSLTDLFLGDSSPDMMRLSWKIIFGRITSLSRCFETHSGGDDSSLEWLMRLWGPGFSHATWTEPS